MGYFDEFEQPEYTSLFDNEDDTQVEENTDNSGYGSYQLPPLFSELDQEDEWEWRPLDRMKSGFKQSVGLLWALGSAGAEAAGADTVSEWAANKAGEWLEASEEYDLVQTSFEEAWKDKDPIEFAKWGAETLAEFLPDLGMMALGGAGAGTAAVKAGGQALTKTMLRKGLKKNIDNILKEQAFKGASTKAVYKEALKRTTYDAGAMLGVAGIEGGQVTGQTWLNDLQKRGDDANPWAAIGAGLGAGAVTVFSPINRLLAKGPKGFKDFTKNPLGITVGEAGEELGQELVIMAHDAGIDPNLTITELVSSDEGIMRLIESGVAGGLLGGLFGGGAKIINYKSEQRRKQDAETLKILQDAESSIQEAGISTEGDVVDPTSADEQTKESNTVTKDLDAKLEEGLKAGGWMQSMFEGGARQEREGWMGNMFSTPTTENAEVAPESTIDIESSSPTSTESIVESRANIEPNKATSVPVDWEVMEDGGTLTPEIKAKAKAGDAKAKGIVLSSTVKNVGAEIESTPEVKAKVQQAKKYIQDVKSGKKEAKVFKPLEREEGLKDWAKETNDEYGKEITFYRKDNDVVIQVNKKNYQAISKKEANSDPVNLGVFKSKGDAVKAIESGVTSEEFYSKKTTETKDTKESIDKTTLPTFNKKQEELYNTIDIDTIVSKTLKDQVGDPDAEAAVREAVIKGVKTYKEDKGASLSTHIYNLTSGALKDYNKKQSISLDVPAGEGKTVLDQMTEEDKVTPANEGLIRKPRQVKMEDSVTVQGNKINLVKGKGNQWFRKDDTEQKNPLGTDVKKVKAKVIEEETPEVKKIDVEEYKKQQEKAKQETEKKEAEREVKTSTSEVGATPTVGKKVRKKITLSKKEVTRKAPEVKLQDSAGKSIELPEGATTKETSVGKKIIQEVDTYEADMYHGTSAEFEGDWKEGRPIFFTLSKEQAGTYGGNLKSRKIKLKNPYVIDFQGRNWTNGPNHSGTAADIARRMRESGNYDGIVYLNIVDPGPKEGAKYKREPTTQVAIFSNESISEVDEALGEPGSLSRKGELPHPRFRTALDIVNFAANTKDTVTSALGRYLLVSPTIQDKLSKVPVYISNKGKGSHFTHYKDGTGTISLASDDALTGIHEAVHAITSRELKSNPIFRKKVLALQGKLEEQLIKTGFITEEYLAKVKATKRATDFSDLIDNAPNEVNLDRQILYALRNEREFLSQAFSSPTVQKLLKSMVVDKPSWASNGKQLRNIWEMFLDIVRSTFNLEPNTWTLLDRVVTITGEIGETELGSENTAYKKKELDEADALLVDKKEKEKKKDWTKMLKTMEGNTIKDKPVDSFKSFASKAKNSLRNIGQGVTEILRGVDRRLLRPIRQMEMKINEKNVEYQKRVKPFFDGYQKLSRSHKLVLDLTLANYNNKVYAAKADEILKKTGLTEAFAEVRKVLDEIYVAKEGVGLNPYKTVKGYFPRRVKDKMGLIQAMKEDQSYNALQHIMDSLGEGATESQKERAIMNYINLGKFPPVALKDPTSSKQRNIKTISSNWIHFYDNAADALINHIYESNEAIYTREFFGDVNKKKALEQRDKWYKQLEEDKLGKKKRLEIAERLDRLEQYLENSEEEFSVGIADFLRENAPNMNDEQVSLVTRAIRARLLQKGMHGTWANVRNVSVGTSLSSPDSAVTQIGDLAFSIYKYGPTATVRGLLGDKIITPKDLDLSHSMKEFQSQGTAKWLDRTLKWSGLQFMDSVGKNTTMNAAIKKAQGMSYEQFKKEYEPVLWEDTEQTFKDIKGGKNTELTRFFAFNELSNFQPVSLSEMPIAYLTGGNGRILYTLKSYNIKALNSIYRESVYKWKNAKTKGEKLKVGRDVGKLITLMVLAGATADELKDWLLGKDAGTFSDSVQDNLLKLALVSRYTVDKGWKSGDIFGYILGDMLAPPTQYITAPFKDVASLFQEGKDPDFTTLKYLPWGKLPYAWFSSTGEKKDQGRLKKEIMDEYKKGASYSSIKSRMNKYNAWARKNDESILKMSSLNRARRNYIEENR